MHFFHILTNWGILFTAYPATDAQFFTLMKLNETSGVVLANVCEVYACATTLLSFLWRNISTPRATVFPISRCVVWGWLYAVEPTSNRSSVKWGFSCSYEPFKPKGLNINFSCARYYLHAHAPHLCLSQLLVTLLIIVFLILKKGYIPETPVS